MLEKNSNPEEVSKIAFNWERVKKKAASKKDELVSNAPKVSKRQPEMNASSPAPIPATSVTDTRITDPYIDIQKRSNKQPSLSSNPASSNPASSNPASSNPKTLRPPIRTTNTDINPITNTPDGTVIPNSISPNGTNTPHHGTTTPQLLPAAAGGDEYTMTSACNDSLGPEANAVELLQGIREGKISGKELTTDERRLVVESMKDLGQTQDAISQLLKVSRRTIVSDYKVLRQQQALVVQSTSTHEIAGEVYAVAKTCMRRALQAGSFKTVSVIMRDMVEVMQSLGVVYRAPKTSMQASWHGKFGSNQGYHKYMDGIGDDKNKVIEVLDCMFNSLNEEDEPTHPGR